MVTHNSSGQIGSEAGFSPYALFFWFRVPSSPPPPRAQGHTFLMEGCRGDHRVSCFVTVTLCQTCFPCPLPGVFSCSCLRKDNTSTFLRLQLNSNSCSWPTLQRAFKEAPQIKVASPSEKSEARPQKHRG